MTAMKAGALTEVDLGLGPYDGVPLVSSPVLSTLDPFQTLVQTPVGHKSSASCLRAPTVPPALATRKFAAARDLIGFQAP